MMGLDLHQRSTRRRIYSPLGLSASLPISFTSQPQEHVGSGLSPTPIREHSWHPSRAACKKKTTRNGTQVVRRDVEEENSVRSRAEVPTYKTSSVPHA